MKAMWTSKPCYLIFMPRTATKGNWNHSDKVTFDQVNNKIIANKGTFPFKGGKGV